VFRNIYKTDGENVSLVESNGSLPPGLWLMSPMGWLLRNGISSMP